MRWPPSPTACEVHVGLVDCSECAWLSGARSPPRLLRWGGPVATFVSAFSVYGIHTVLTAHHGPHSCLFFFDVIQGRYSITFILREEEEEEEEEKEGGHLALHLR